MKFIGWKILIAMVSILSQLVPVSAQLVDGDLSDLELLQQAASDDTINDVCPAGKSGFDIQRVIVYYDVLNDDLYLGLNLFDVFQGGQGVGMLGPGVPGDADGDNDPSTFTNLACQVKVDQPGVGIDETYVITFDTDGDGNFETSADFRLEYRNNDLTMTLGDGTIVPNDPSGLSAMMVLGTAGAGGGDTAIPNQSENPIAFENPLTEDIEIVVHNFSLVDPIPQCFSMQLFAGSLRDLLPEDILPSFLAFDPFTPSISLQKEARNLTQQGSFQDDVVSVQTGDRIRFRLTIQNDGEIPLRSLLLGDILPSGLENPVSGDPKCIFSGTSLMCQFPSLGIGEVKTILFEASVTAQAGTTLINEASVVAQTPEGECSDQEVSASDPVTIQVVGIRCEKQVSLDDSSFSQGLTADTGQTAFFRVDVSNDSAVTLSAVSILDQLPAGYTDVESDDPRVQITGNLVFAFLEDLPAGGTDIIRYRATVQATNPPTSSLTNTATVSGLSGQTLVASECSSTVAINTIELSCEKRASIDGLNFSDTVVASPGQRVGFEVIVSNNGTSSFFNVNLRDVLPAGFEVPLSDIGGCPFLGNVLDCDLGPLAPGESVRVTYSARVSSQVDVDLTNTVTVTGTVGSSSNPGVSVVSDCVAVTQVRNPRIECEKLLSLDGVTFESTVSAVTGQTVLFKIRATNSGPVSLSSVTIVDDVPSAYGNLTSADPGVTIVGSFVTCDLGTLAPGESGECSLLGVVVATNPSTTSIVNTAFVTGASGTPGNPGEVASSSCSSTMPLLRPEINCDKNVSLDGVSFFNEVLALPGATVFFEVIITNPGEADFFQVNLSDLVPAGFVNLTSSDPRCSVQGNSLTCDLGAIAAGGSDRVVFQADVALGAPSTLVNTADVIARPGTMTNPGAQQITSCGATVNSIEPELNCVKEASLSFAGPFGSAIDAAPGQRVFFRVTLSNDSQGDLTFDSVRITDEVPVGFSDVQVLFGACSANGNTVSCADLGSLPQGAQISVVFSAVVSATNPPTASLTNIAFAEALLSGTVVDTHECSAVVNVPDVDIECVKRVSLDGVSFSNSATAVPGQTVIFRVDVQNAGSSDFFALTLQDTLPAGYENPISLDGRCSFVGNDLSCDLGPLGAGGSTTILYSATVGAGASGLLRNTASVFGTPGSLENPGVVASSTCSSDVTVGTPDIDCVKRVSLDGSTFSDSITATRLQSVRFRVEITNTGSSSLFGVSLTDTLPAGFEEIQIVSGACSVAGNTITCADLGVLSPGQTVTVQYQARISASPPSDPLVNTAVVGATSGIPDNPGIPVGDNCIATINLLDVDLECDKGASLDGVSFSTNLDGVSTGQLVTFRVTLQNSGEARLREDIGLVDVLPAGFADVESLDARCDVSGNTLSCSQLGPLDPGQSTSVLFRARVTAVAPASLTNTATVTGISGTTVNPGEDATSVCSVPVALGTPEVVCDKTVSLDGLTFSQTARVVSGQNQIVTFRVVITNNGSVPFFTANLTDVVPAGFADVESLEARCDVTGNTLTCADLGPLAPGASTEIRYRARVTATNPPTESLTNTARVTATPGTSENPGDSVSDDCQSTIEIVNAVLRCEKMVSANGIDFFDSIAASAGQTMIFRVTVFNDSTSDATFDPVLIAVTLPGEYEDVEAISGSCDAVGHSINCSIGPLAPGESVSLLYRATLRDDLEEGVQAVNTANATTEFETVELASQCSATVTIQAGIVVCLKEASLDGVSFFSTVQAAPGQRIEFRVVLQNTGSVDFFESSLVDVLPAGFEDVIARDPSCSVAGNTLICDDLGPLVAGGSIEIRYAARLVDSLGAGTLLTNLANVSATPGTPENPGIPVTSQCSAETLVLGLGLQCLKEASLDGVSFSTSLVVVAGQRVFYRVVVTNAGQADLFAVSLSDSLPSGLADPQTSTQGCSFTSNTLDCDLGPVASGASVTVFYSARVASDASGDLVNRATVEGRAGSADNPSRPVGDDCQATVMVLTPAIACDKNVSLDGFTFADTVSAVPGQILFFEIVVSNSGPVTFFEALIRDELPARLINPQASSPDCGFAGRTLECALGALASGESRRVTFMATLSGLGPGIVVNIATVEGTPGSAANPGATAVSECPATVNVETPAITCLKEVSKDGINYLPSVDGLAGESVFYRVVVSNSGDVDLFDVHVSDLLPFGLSNLQTADSDCVVVGNNLDCDLGILPAGGERVIEYSAVIISEGGDLVNLAVVTGTPGTLENPGTPVTSSCSAVVRSGPRRIPTLSEWGLILLALFLGGAIVMRRNAL